MTTTREGRNTATLEVLDGPQKGKVYRLDREETVVGRLVYCDVLLAERNVSRQHARLVRTRGEYFVEDLNSTNGTFLNGKRVMARTRLRDQDVIRVYNVPLLFREPEPAPEEPPPPPDGWEKGTSRAHRVHLVKKTDPGSVIKPPAAAERGLGLNVYEKLRVVLEITKKLGSTLNVQEMLPRILEGLFAVFPQSDRGYVLLPDGESGRLLVRAQKQKEEGTFVSTTLGPISHTVAGRVMSQGEAVLLADGVDSEDLDLGDSVLDFPIRSMMCAPLIGPMHKPLGIIYVDTNDPNERFHEDDLEVLLSVAATAGQAVEYAAAHEARMRLVRRERELAMAKQVQLHFLPQRRPQVPGYRFFDYYASAEEVGGDYYGFVPLENGQMALTLGDVSGKGMSAALVMARLCSEVRYRLATAGSPTQAFEELNREFALPEHEAFFVTFLLCVLDPARNRITLLNAGHMPPVCRRGAGGEVEVLGGDLSGPPLGCSAAIRYAPCTVELRVGDALVMFTDGISEAMNPHRSLYGNQRLLQAVQVAPGELDQLCQSLLDDMWRFTQEHPQSDDICLVGLQRES
jgi:serine phosphatase RsbU (regulator of sigma subunit)